MSEQGIDKLKIEIDATAKKADSELDKLIVNLNQLKRNLQELDGASGNLSHISRTFESFARSLNGIDAGKMKTMSNAMASFARSAQSLGGVSKSLAMVQGSVARVGEAFNNISTDKSKEEISELLWKEQQIFDYSKQAKESLRGMLNNVGIPENAKADLGDMFNELRAFVGIRNTSKGGLSGGEIEEIANALQKAAGVDISGLNNDVDIFATLGETLRNLTHDIEQSESHIKSYEEQLKNLENDDFMTLDDDTDDLFMFADGLDSASDSAQNLATNMHSLEGVNPFESVVETLKQLEGLNVPTESISSLSTLIKQLNKAGGASVDTGFGITLQQLSSGLRSMQGLEMPNLSGMAEFVKQLGKLNGVKIQGAVANMPSLASGLRAVSNIGEIKLPDTSGIANFATQINLLGRAKVSQAVENIPRLTVAIQQMMDTLSRAPMISENVIRMTDAMANLAAQGSKVGTASNSLNRVFSGIGTSSEKTRGIIERLKGALSNITSHFHKTSSASKGLASSIGLLYAKFWALFRLFGLLKKAMGLSSSVTEVQNVVDTTFGQYAGLVDNLAKSSIQMFGMSELTVKQIASRFQAMGSAMGLTTKQVQTATDYLAKKNAVYDVTGNKMADMSVELTKLMADMASFYNMEQNVVSEDLEAIFTGQTRPLRKYGLDLTQATLKEWAMSQGLNANVAAMTQAEKTMLRYQYVMAHTSHIMGDFERTADTWANQTRMLRQNFEQLGIVIGQGLIQALKPAVRAMNAFLVKVTNFARNVVNALGKIFGWKIEMTTAGITDDLGESADAMGGIADAADGASGGLGKAADNAKKLNNQLREWDKLNVITTQDDKSGKGGSGGGSGAGGGGGAGDEGEVVANITRTEGLFDSLIDNLTDLGRYLNEALLKALLRIPWSEIQKKARDFGRGFAEFLNGFFENSETFYIAGNTVAKALNTIMYAFEEFGKNFNFANLGTDLAEFINGFSHGIDWVSAYNIANIYGIGIADAINAFVDKIDATQIGKNLANTINVFTTFFHDLGSTIRWTEIGKRFSDGVNGFLDTINATKLGRTFNIWANGILDAADTAISRINWTRLGTKIGTLLSEINFPQLLAKFGKVLAKAIVGAIEALSFSVKEAPVESAMIAAFAVFKWAKLGGFVSKTIVAAIARKLGVAIVADNTISGTLSSALGKKLASGLKLVFAQLGKTLLNIIDPLLVSMATSGTALGTAFVNAIGAVMSGGVAVLGPVALAVAAVVGVIAKVHDDLTVSEREMEKVFTETGMDVYIQKTASLRDSLDNLKRASTDIGEVYKNDILDVQNQMTRIDSLTAAYERLSSKNILTFDEQEKLKNVSSELASIFPELNQNINEQGILVGVDAEKFAALKENLRETLEYEAKRNEYLSYYEKYNEAVDGMRVAYGNYKDSLKAVQDYQTSHRDMTIEERKELEILKEKVDEAKLAYSDYGEYIDIYGQHLNNINKELFDADTAFGKASVSANLMNEGLLKGDASLTEISNDLIGVKSSADVAASGFDNSTKKMASFREYMSGTSVEYKGFAKIITDENGNINGSEDEVMAKLDEVEKNYIETTGQSSAAIGVLRKDVKAYYDDLSRQTDTGNAKLESHKGKLNEAEGATKSLGTQMDTTSGQMDNLMSKSGQTFTINNSGFDSLTKSIKDAWEGLKNLFGFNNQTVTVNHQINQRTNQMATGGVLVGNKWRAIQQYAGGGLPRTAEIFMARENGLPEMVGSLGGHTAVMNNDQIVASVSDGVARAVSSSMAQEIAVLRQQNEYLRAIANKNFGISSREVFNATRQEANDYMRRTGNPAFGF